MLHVSCFTFVLLPKWGVWAAPDLPISEPILSGNAASSGTNAGNLWGPRAASFASLITEVAPPQID